MKGVEQSESWQGSDSGSSPFLRWLISCANLARPQYPDIWTDTSLDIAMEAFFG